MRSSIDNQDAVSPVVGTSLLVAIVVIIAAIISSMVLGMIPVMSEMKTVGITAQPFSDDKDYGVSVMVTGGADAASLVNLTVGYRNDMDFQGPTGLRNVIQNPVVGIPVSLTVTSRGSVPIPSPLSGPFTLTGHFTDGTSQVLYQKNLVLEKLEL